MWIRLPKSGFNATEMLLAKCIWVGFLSGFLALFFWEDEAFLTHMVIIFRLQREFACLLQIWHTGIWAMGWDSGHSLSVLRRVTASVLPL